jgi:ABC-type cobalamin/Fe3+-siderophores transport system ATPase subunit
MKIFTMAVKEIKLPYFEVTPATPSISFELPLNKISFLLGANGSGKSTLLKALLGFIKPTTGYCSSQELSAQERAESIAWIDQSVSNDIAYTAAQVVTMSGANQKAVDAAMAALDVTRYAQKPFMQLSGGEQRRVHLARALAQSAPWLLLDEPTTHLDITHELQLLNILGKLAALNRSVLMATHNPAHVNLVPVEALGMMLIMENGCLVFQGDACDTASWRPKLCEVLGVTEAQLGSLF